MDGLKQRIIGALVLISLAVIFVPMVFDEPHSERTSTSINIPEEPPFPEVEAPESDIAPPPSYQQDQASSQEPAAQDFKIVENGEPAAQPATGNSDSAEPESDSAEPEVAKSVAPEPAAPEPVTSKEPETPVSTEQTEAEFTRSLKGAWVVQLGSFGNSDNARGLRDDVREKGYNSHLQEVVRGDNTLTRVFSGPFAEKSKAEAAKRTLDKAFGLNSLVTSGAK
ncbi:MAG: SPOR domain-containing protein [Marinobacter sp.]|uniref:SPOR domain-containing protein n=1 Tax=Marinobacter sp. TaxID=50741 RepID=UPI003F970F51